MDRERESGRLRMDVLGSAAPAAGRDDFSEGERGEDCFSKPGCPASEDGDWRRRREKEEERVVGRTELLELLL
jgi:hypothetical protein